jgi:hypothetical protein
LNTGGVFIGATGNATTVNGTLGVVGTLIAGAVTTAGNLTIGDDTSSSGDAHTLNGKTTSVYTSTSASFIAGNSGLVIRDLASAAGVGGGIEFQGIYTGSTATEGGLIKLMKTNGTDGNYSFDLVFGTRPNGGNLTEVLRLYDGVANLGAKLTGGLTIDGAPTAQLQTTGDTTVNFDFNNGSDTTLTLDNAGAGAFTLALVGKINANSTTPASASYIYSLQSQIGDASGAAVWGRKDSLGYDYIINTAAQAVSETTTPTDSTDLQIGNIAAGEVYFVEGLLFLSCNDTAGDTQFRFAASAGTFAGRGQYQSYNAADSAANNGVDAYSAVSTTTTIQGGCANDRPHPIRFAYTFTWAGSTGALKLQFSPVTNGGGTQTATLQKGSYFRFYRML